MKKVLMVLLLLFTVAVVHAQSITVRSQEAEGASFRDYKTFGWASHVSNELEAGVYFLNDLVLKAQVRDAVKGQLMGLGYQMADNPDLIVNFRVFDQATTLSGNAAYGEDYWGTTNYTGMETESIDVEAGTLLVSLADRESGKVVWQGFASGLIDNNQFIKDEGKIHEAVNMIFADYNRSATTYDKK